MDCECCGQGIKLARKVKMRRLKDFDPSAGGPESAAYESFVNDMTYRWAFICNACYRVIDDSDVGIAEISGRQFNLAGASRGDKASTVNESQYMEFQRKQAGDMGLDI